MKFGKLLRVTATELPEVERILDFYKHAKKVLKAWPSAPDASQYGSDVEAQRDKEFVETLSAHLSHFIETFQARLQAFHIRCSAMEEQAAKPACHQDKVNLHQQVLDFHGEALLMMHWSMLAYTGCVKLMKKYQKRTHKLLDSAEVASLLHHPFCSSEGIPQLAARADTLLAKLSDELGIPRASGAPVGSTSDVKSHAKVMRVGTVSVGLDPCSQESVQSAGTSPLRKEQPHHGARDERMESLPPVQPAPPVEFSVVRPAASGCQDRSQEALPSSDAQPNGASSGCGVVIDGVRRMVGVAAKADRMPSGAGVKRKAPENYSGQEDGHEGSVRSGFACDALSRMTGTQRRLAEEASTAPSGGKEAMGSVQAVQAVEGTNLCDSGSADGSVKSMWELVMPGGTPAGRCMITKAQVALKTWQHLHNNSRTPSTCYRNE